MIRSIASYLVIRASPTEKAALRPPFPKLDKSLSGGPLGGTIETAGGLHNLAGLQAGSADAELLGNTVDQSAGVLQIRIPPALGDVVGMGNVVPELGLLAANLALTGHGNLDKTGKLDMTNQYATRRTAEGVVYQLPLSFQGRISL
jgi:hypothetical protein